jgi:hypothetical protein
VLIVLVDRPGITRTTEDGLHPAVSVYRTEKVKMVLGLPEPGVARPELSVV